MIIFYLHIFSHSISACFLHKKPRASRKARGKLLPQPEGEEEKEGSFAGVLHAKEGEQANLTCKFETNDLVLRAYCLVVELSSPPAIL
jgi:hypothetical protein